MSEIILQLLASEYMKTLLAPEMLVKYTQFMMLFGVVWASMYRKAREGMKDLTKSADEHFKKIESNLKQMTEGINRLEQAMTTGFKNSDERISRIEERLTKVEDIVQP